MRCATWIAIHAALLISPQAMSHTGTHGGSALSELWHTLTAADHAVPLFIGAGLIALAFWLALRRTPSRQSRKARRSSSL